VSVKKKKLAKSNSNSDSNSDIDSDSDNDSDGESDNECIECENYVSPGHQYCTRCSTVCQGCNELFGAGIEIVRISNKDFPFTMKVCPGCRKLICLFCGEIDTDDVCKCEALSKFCRD